MTVLYSVEREWSKKERAKKGREGTKGLSCVTTHTMHNIFLPLFFLSLSSPTNIPSTTTRSAMETTSTPAG
jgi:hypothetical protein